MYELDNLEGREFGIWKVLKFDHMEYYGANHKHGMSYYKCECKKCGAISLVARSHLTHAKCSYHYGCKGKQL